MATVPCSKCTAERKGFRRELDSWRHKLIHCIGFESILEGIYGPLLLRDLSLFDDFEPDEVIDWSPEENCSHCSFCNLPLEKLNDHALSSTSPLSSPSDYSPRHVPALSESSQSAHRFLQAVFNKKDVPLDCDPNIPLIAQELMKKMIRQFAMEYASKCLLHTTTNGVQTKTMSPQSETADAPLDLTVSRSQEEKEPQPDGVLDLSNRKSASLPTSKPSLSNVNHKGLGRQQRQKEYIERSLELSEGLLSKALKDIRSGRLQEHRAALLYGIPLQVLKQGQESWPEEALLQHLSPGNRDVREEVSSYCVMSSMLGGEARLVLQKVAAWAERAEIGGAAEEIGDFSFPSSSLTFFQTNKTIPQSFPQLRDALQPPSSPTPSLECPAPLRIPQVRSVSDQSRSLPTENGGAAESLHLRTSTTEGTASVPVLSSAVRPLFKLRPSVLAHSSNLSPHRLGARASLVDDMEEGADRRDKDKQPRKKRGRYRQYDHELMEEAITMVMGGRMSVSKAQGIYGVPHSTLEYKVKERTGTLKNPPKKKSAIPCSPSTVSVSGSTCSATSGILTSAAPTNSCSLSTTEQEREELQCHGTKISTLGAVLSALCPAHHLLLYRILKIAHQHKLFLKSLKVQPECYCCHYHGTRSDCTTHNCCQHWLIDHCSSKCHTGESKSNCSTHHCALKECVHETDWDSNSCSVQLCKGDTCTIICPKRVHGHSCQSLSSTNINNLVCSFTPTVPSPSVLGLCSLSICCNQHNTVPCSCHLMHSSLTEDKSTNFTENEGDITALKQEQSPSPPPLSPIPELNKQRDERPPVLHHQIQDEEAEPIGKIRGNANLKKYSVKRQNWRSTYGSQTKKTNGTLLQDVVSRFSEKLDTIKPSEKDASLVTAPEAEKQQLHCTSKCVHLNADAHLTEIITTVLHTGSSSEYNLGELINYHNNKEPQSPNTRSRCRQEMLAAMATPTKDATTRRQTLQIKRELARLNQSQNKQKRAMLINGESTLNQLDEEFEQVETVKLNSDTPNKPKTATVVSQVEDETQEEDTVVSIKEEANVAVFKETPSSFQGKNWELAHFKTVKNLDKKCKPSNCAKNVQSSLSQSSSSRRARKSQRNIVPPPRYSSYVTEPRKMYFVACFSDTIFNQRNRTDEGITSPQDLEPHHENDASESTNQYSLRADIQSQGIPTIKNRSPTKNDSDTLMDNKSVAKCRRRLQVDDKTMPSTCIDNTSLLAYTSPIKLMFVSPVKDEEGMKYSLKSAAAVNGSQADQCFDPCEESSWSGTPEKSTRQSTNLATQIASPVKSSVPLAKPASASPRSSPKTSPKSSPSAKAGSPKSNTPSPKSSPSAKAGSPKSNTPSPKSSPSAKGGSLKSNTPSPKVGTRRLGDNTPTTTVDDSQRFSHDVSGMHENTPPKRRRGRPKKLGPQLEKKVKRPIGRPRKEKVMESTVKEKVHGNTEVSDTEKNVNKNLKITVLYGRSRRNKRMVSEGFDQLQTEFHDACQAVGLNKNWSMLMKTTKVNSGDLKTASVELSQKIPIIRPVKDCAPLSKIIKCSTDDAAPSRKPGRPAKVKISGISVTVTTVSPRQRKIQINKDKAPPVKQKHKRALFQKSVSAKEHKTITCHSVSKSSDEEQHSEETKGESEANPHVAIRHSERVRKPSIHFLHAVATSSSYSCSSALVRRSKHLLLNKTKKDDSQNILQPSREKREKDGKGKASSVGLQQIATVSIDSVYHPKEMKWWSTSMQEKTLNQELARRIRLISESWVSDTVGKETGFGTDKSSSPSSRKSKCSSVVRSLFDCSPNKPRSCSMQQLCSWFMQTTETQSLSIVKKTSSRNPYEVMHFPRSTCKKTTCYSPQAERLRKHLKKFAKSVPKTPNDYAQAQKKIHRRNTVSKPIFKYWNSTTIAGKLNYIAKGKSKSFSTYKASLYRAKRSFLTRKQRKIRVNNKTHILNGHATRHPKQKTLATGHFLFSGQPLDPAHVAEEHLCSEHSSPETMKECRVFLRKIYSPNNGAAKDEDGSHTVTLDKGSPAEILLSRNEKGVNTQAVKTEHISPKRGCFRHSESHSPNSVQGQHVEPMRGRTHENEVLFESPQPPPAKRLRQSRMTGLSGPRWRDFVFEN